MGIEALSRGAAELVAVDEKRAMVRIIEENLRKIGYEAKVICADARKFIPALAPESFDIIFADPPYQSLSAEKTLEMVQTYRLLKPDGILAIEHSTAKKLPEHAGPFVKTRTREWGQTAISFYEIKDWAERAEGSPAE
jgi:16S rRNA (guanine(966)-N(2))-methyltransferase RsmD